MALIGNQVRRTMVSSLQASCRVTGRNTSTCNYSVSGEENTGERPLLILHGALGSCKNWKSLSMRLAKSTNKPVYALDAPNHGDSSWTDSMSYDSSVQTVVEFMQQKSISKADLLGHSMGGKTAMIAALQHSELFEKLVIVDAAPTVSNGVAAIATYITVMKELDLTALERLSQVSPALEAHIPETGIREFIAMNAVRDKPTGKLGWRCNLQAIEDFLPEMAVFPILDISTGVKTLFIGGEDSQYINSKSSKEIRRLFTNVDICKIPGGHWVHYDNPSGFLETLLPFLNSQ